MRSIITSYLLQTRECSLAHIGTFIISTKSAELDIVHKQILPPADEIIFTEGTPPSSPGLIKYVAQIKNVNVDEAENLVDDFCNQSKEQLQANQALIFDTLGSLQKNNDDKIIFKKENSYAFLQPVFAERVLHENAKHMVLVGDKEDSSSLVNEYYDEETVKTKPRWWIWAASLAAIGLAVSAYHFSKHSFSPTSAGNQSHFIIDSAFVNHFEPAGN